MLFGSKVIEEFHAFAMVKKILSIFEGKYDL
jgi:hypothetical protein